MRWIAVGVICFAMLWAGNGRAQGGTPAAAGDDKSLVGYWRFDGDLTDASGRGNDAKGNAEFAEGKEGKALRVKGQHLQIPGSPELGLAPGFALDCWAFFDKKPENAGANVIIQKAEPDIMKGGEYLLRVDPKGEGGQISFFTYLNGGWEPRVRSKVVPEAGRWYHIRAGWTGMEVSLEVDGEKASKFRLGGPAPAKNPVVVGPLAGRMDELKIYNPSDAVFRAARAATAAFPDANRLRQTSFGKAGGWPEWRAGGGAEMREERYSAPGVNASSLAVTLPNAGAMVFNPGLDVDLGKKRYVCIDLVCKPAETANLLFVTDNGAAVVPFPVLDVKRTTVIDLGSDPRWKGRLKFLGLFFDDRPHVATVQNLWISERQEGTMVQAKAVEIVPRRVEVGDLMCEWFAHLATYWGQRRMLLSGWDVQAGEGGSDKTPANVYSYSYYDWFKLTAAANRSPVTIRKRFVAQQDGALTWEFEFHLPKLGDGPAFSLQSGAKRVLTLAVQGGKLMAQGAGEPVAMADLRPNEACGVLAHLDLATRQATLRINGRTCATPARMADGKDALDHVEITTGRDFTGDLFLGPVLLYRGFALRERFITVPVGVVPDDWTAETGGGSVSVQGHGGGTLGTDRNALKLEKRRDGTVAAATRFAPVAGPVEIECKLRAPQTANGVQFAATDAEGRVVAAIETRDGNWVFPVAGGQPQVLWKGYRTTVWYDLRLVVDPKARTAAAFVNNIPVATRLKVSEVRGGIAGVRVAAPETGTATVFADDLVVRPHLPYPDDYVPEPQPVATGPVLVGMQSCDLWREGLHNGWGFIQPHPERKPLLGYYNGGDPEVEDWAIKWMCENGIAFDFKCWYRGEPGFPIYSTAQGAGLDGFQRSRWGGKMHFAINITNHSSMFSSLDDWKQNVAPYLIEHLFRDPRYLLIDNKPLIGIYDPHWLNRNVGDAKAAVEFLREECRKAGFAGCWVLAQTGENDAGKLADFAKWGFDAVYAYGWGAVNAKGQEEDVLAQRARKAIDILPTLVMGRDDRAWDGPKGYWLSAEEFRGLLQWARDQYMPEAPADALSRRIVVLGNWNEYGEGHFMMPTALMGFGYVNTVREVFGKKPFPPNVTPTPAQQARLDTLYPKGDW